MNDNTKYHWQWRTCDGNDVYNNNNSESGRKKIHPNQKAVYIMRGDGQGVPLFDRRWFYEDEARQIVDEHNEQINAALRAAGKLGAHQEVALDPKLYDQHFVETVKKDVEAPKPYPPAPVMDKRKEAINNLMEIHLKNVLATSGSLNELLTAMSGR